MVAPAATLELETEDVVATGSSGDGGQPAFTKLAPVTPLRRPKTTRSPTIAEEPIPDALIAALERFQLRLLDDPRSHASLHLAAVTLANELHDRGLYTTSATVIDAFRRRFFDNDLTDDDAAILILKIARRIAP